MELRFGGCFRQDPPMKRLPNFIDAQSATTLGVTTPSQTHTHTPHYLLYHLVRYYSHCNLDQAFLQS
jgi:hypothetical protein